MLTNLKYRLQLWFYHLLTRLFPGFTRLLVMGASRDLLLAVDIERTPEYPSELYLDLVAKADYDTGLVEASRLADDSLVIANGHRANERFRAQVELLVDDLELITNEEAMNLYKLINSLEDYEQEALVTIELRNYVDRFRSTWQKKPTAKKKTKKR